LLSRSTEQSLRENADDDKLFGKLFHDVKYLHPKGNPTILAKNRGQF
jgi:hypothetical protein